MILIDSNILVAAIVADHPANDVVVDFLIADPPPTFVVAAHSYAEAFATLTRRSGPSPFALEAGRAIAGLQRFRRQTVLAALTAEQTVSAVEEFARIGTGARLYDYLIGRTGILHGATAIVTLNVRHMRALFAETWVLTPADWLAARA